MSIETQTIQAVSEMAEIPFKVTSQVLNLLFEEKCTVPFIARYRKEKTGDLDEVGIRKIEESYHEYTETEKRRAYILETIEKLGKLDAALKAKILNAATKEMLEDLYAPYKSKRKTKGLLAIEAGLEPLALDILADKTIKATDKEIAGACDIIIERMSQHLECKKSLRENVWEIGVMASSVKKAAKTDPEALKFKDYFEYEEKVKDLKRAKAGHRYLAMRRGMTLKFLKVETIYPEEKANNTIATHVFPNASKNRKLLEECSNKAWANYILPSLDLEIKGELKKFADEGAIHVFGENLRNLLLQPYLGSKAVLGIDPGIRTGCKIALVDDNGKFLIDTVIYPFPPQNKKTEAKKIIDTILEKFPVQHIALGNGTFGRETMDFLQTEISKVKAGTVKAVLVNEDGASIYSASDIAREEFPDKDVTVRGAISIARRFQDPLAELVKIEPKSIGVGQYQHDVNQTKLKKSLEGVVESCVNFVGVDLNTASGPLLSHISGIGPTLAKNIVKHRQENGSFKTRKELQKVARFGQKNFEQAAGFLRIYSGKNPLDATFVHPENYPLLEKWAKSNSTKIEQLVKDKQTQELLEVDSKLKDEIGPYTFDDIVKSLSAPKQDPRTEFKNLEFRKDIRSIGDLKTEQWYPGIITNITHFGAFVDLGIKENGLLHVSQMADKFVEDPLKEFKVGQQLKVRVVEVDASRKRISLSCKGGDSKPSTTPAKKQNKQIKQKENKPKNAFSGLKDFKVR